jgi:tungstate transport system substrate-binding protein
MAGCLTLADEMSAYALTDRATFQALEDRLHLRPLVEGDSLLANPYSLIVVDPRCRPGGNHAGARRLVAWLVSPEGRRRIAAFQPRGEMLFVPEGGPPG